MERKALWIHCPICNGKTRVKVYKGTVLLHFPLYCPKCRKEISISVVNWKMVQCGNPNDSHTEGDFS